MSIFDDLTDKVTKTAKAAAKKSGELVEITRLNINIGMEEEKISRTFSEIGKLVYDSFESIDDVPDNLKEYYSKLKNYEQNIKDLKQKILELKNIKYCSGCNEELEINSAYCSKCGAKQEDPVVDESTEINTLPLCSNCHKNINDGSLYCSFCGTKVDI